MVESWVVEEVRQAALEQGALTKEQVRRVAELVRGAARGSDVARVALVIDPAGLALAHRIEQGRRGNNRVRSFKSLHEARRWITEPARA